MLCLFTYDCSSGACFDVTAPIVIPFKSTLEKTIQISESFFNMRFLAVASALAVLVNVTSAAHHSGRSLKHVGMADKHHPKVRRREPQQQKQRCSDSSRYLTNSTASEYIHAVRIA
jgi:hypothetical protein